MVEVLQVFLKVWVQQIQLYQLWVQVLILCGVLQGLLWVREVLMGHLDPWQWLVEALILVLLQVWVLTLCGVLQVQQIQLDQL